MDELFNTDLSTANAILASTVIPGSIKVTTEIAELYEKAQRNKSICKEMAYKIQIAKETIEFLKLHRDENEICSKKYDKLDSVTKKMRGFILEISQQRNLISIVKADNIRKRASDLNEEFGSIVQLTKFSLIADLRARVYDNNKIIQNLSEVTYVICKFYI
jgi:hypothetical protein